jgi:uncharacterized protein with HEPN domain
VAVEPNCTLEGDEPRTCRGGRPRHTGDQHVADAALAAVQFRVFTIGEAVKTLPAELTGRRSEVPRSDIVRMRDLIGHHYYKLDAQIVLATTGQPPTALRDACQAPRDWRRRWCGSADGGGRDAYGSTV